MATKAQLAARALFTKRAKAGAFRHAPRDRISASGLARREAFASVKRLKSYGLIARAKKLKSGEYQIRVRDKHLPERNR